MSFSKKNKIGDYDSLGSSKKKDGQNNHDQSTLKSSHKSKKQKRNGTDESNLLNYTKEQKQKIISHNSVDKEPEKAEFPVLKSENPKLEKGSEKSEIKITKDERTVTDSSPPVEENYAEKLKKQKQIRRAEKDFEILENESWVVRNGHFFTYIGLFCFSILVYLRPYELVSGLGFLKATAFYFAAATLAIYLPTQFSTDGTLTTLSTEVKCILLITFLAVFTMPIAKSPGMAWEEFNDSFIKAVAMFIVMVNVLRTRVRLMGMIWLLLFAGVVLSYMALDMYWRGEVTVEGYRVAVEMGGMFGNPNELALHLVLMTPLAVTLGLAAKNKLMKIGYFVMAGLFVGANVVTYSRGGFLGLMAIAIFLIWKLGKKQKLKIYAVSFVGFILFILLVPGEYGQRVFSIFDSSLDAVGSSNQRTDLLKRSILVSIRNPWGIGIGNFPIVGYQNLGTHNAFTQVSSELGVVSFVAYLIFLISPFRKLGAIERRLAEKADSRWFYYLGIGLQASIIGYLVSGFFAAVAYNWFAYYLIAYAVAFRRIYLIEKDLKEEDIKADSLTENLPGWQTKSA
jgi:O-antigen ligase